MTTRQLKPAVGPFDPVPSSFDNAVPDGVTDQFTEIAQVELRHNMSPMRLSGLDADVEGRGDLFVAMSLNQELDDLLLALGQASVAADLGRRTLQVTAEHHFGDRAGEEQLALGNSLDGCDQLAGGVRLQNVPAGAGCEDLPHQVLRVVHRENQNLGV